MNSEKVNVNDEVKDEEKTEFLKKVNDFTKNLAKEMIDNGISEEAGIIIIANDKCDDKRSQRVVALLGNGGSIISAIESTVSDNKEIAGILKAGVTMGLLHKVLNNKD